MFDTLVDNNVSDSDEEIDDSEDEFSLNDNDMSIEEDEQMDMVVEPKMMDQKSKKHCRRKLSMYLCYTAQQAITQPTNSPIAMDAVGPPHLPVVILGAKNKSEWVQELKDPAVLQYVVEKWVRDLDLHFGWQDREDGEVCLFNQPVDQLNFFFFGQRNADGGAVIQQMKSLPKHLYDPEDFCVIVNLLQRPVFPLRMKLVMPVVTTVRFDMVWGDLALTIRVTQDLENGFQPGRLEETVSSRLIIISGLGTCLYHGKDWTKVCNSVRISSVC
jgi:hypothetical protein